MSEGRDQWGLTVSDYRQIDRALLRYDDQQRWRAFKALWCRPVTARVRRDGVTEHRSNRGDEWTLWRSTQATIAIAFNRRWNDIAERSWKQRLRSRCISSWDMAYWDCLPVYGGYTVDVMRLYPGLRVSIHNDGESEKGW